jgi:hypothetical protein
LNGNVIGPINWENCGTRLRVGRSGFRILVRVIYLLSSTKVQIGLWTLLASNEYGSSLPWLKISHSSPYSAEVKNKWRYVSTAPIRLHGIGRDNFTFI